MILVLPLYSTTIKRYFISKVTICRSYSGGWHRRLPLTSKSGNKDYYKGIFYFICLGKNSGKMGEIDKWGFFHVDPTRVRNYIVPDLTGFQVWFKYASYLS